MKKIRKLFAMLLAACILFACLPMGASAGGIDTSSYTTIIKSVQEKIKEVNSYHRKLSKGFLYDIDGNGTQELVLSYFVNNQKYNIPEAVFSLYTKRGGRVIPYFEERSLFIEAGGPYAYGGAAERNGEKYFVIATGNGDDTWSSGITLYELNGSSAVEKLSAGASVGSGAGSLSAVKELEDSFHFSYAFRINTSKPEADASAKSLSALLTEAEALEKSQAVAGFLDVSKEDFFAEPVKWAVGNHITTGASDTNFDPYAPCTRAQAVVFLYRAFDEPEVSLTTSEFGDLKQGSFYCNAANWAQQNGIANGKGVMTTPSGEEKLVFSPGATCTRAEIVTFLWRAQGSPKVEKANSFSDVKADSWYADAVRWASENGIAQGIGSGMFGPNQTCTRGQIVTFLYRCMG